MLRLGGNHHPLAALTANENEGDDQHEKGTKEDDRKVEEERRPFALYAAPVRAQDEFIYGATDAAIEGRAGCLIWEGSLSHLQKGPSWPTEQYAPSSPSK